MPQAKKLTLEDVIPGGKNYKKFFPSPNEGFQLAGEQLFRTKGDSLLVRRFKDKTKDILITSTELNEWLATSGLKVKDLRFQETASGRILAYIPYKKDATSYFILDIFRKQIVKQIPVSEDYSHTDFFMKDKSCAIAFTVENNLYVSTQEEGICQVTFEESPYIISGQATHRFEFGINKGTFWSPSGKQLAFYKTDESMVGDYPLVDVSAREARLKNTKYPMAGMKSHEVKVGVYDLQTRQTTMLKTGYPKDRYFTNVCWTPDEKYICITEVSRSQDTATVILYNARTGKKAEVLLRETHQKYIEPENPPHFLKDKSTFLYLSERSGYNHLYLYNPENPEGKPITSGNWDVLRLYGTDSEGNVYYLSTEASPLEENLYRINLKTGEKQRLTPQEGCHSIFFPDSKRFFTDLYSNAGTPPVYEFVETSSGKRQVISGGKNPFSEYDIPEIQTGTIKAADDSTDLYYRLVYPVNFDPQKQYPVIVYVYGGPHAQLIKNAWLNATRGWDLYMAQEGYVIFTLDNRGSANRGLAFENVTYCKLGIYEAEDQRKGIDFLLKLPFIDPSRIGVHGWSFGGYMTVNLMLRYPGLFKAGVSGAPVIDWKYYEIMYGERYMGTPQNNPEGYKNSNLNNLAQHLEDKLLVIHGDQDPVVVWQHSLSFLSACIKARTYPDYFVYPGHEHHVNGKDRIHLYHKITRYFNEHLK